MRCFCSAYLKFSNHDSQVTAFEAEPYPVYLMSSSSRVEHQNSLSGGAGGSYAQQHAASASSSPTPQTAGMNTATATPPPPTATTDTNARMLKRQRMRNKLQRGHHWMPLSEAETGFLMTDADRARGVYDSSRDKLVFPFMQYKFPVHHVENASQISSTCSMPLVMLNKSERKFCHAETAFLVCVREISCGYPSFWSTAGSESSPTQWWRKTRTGCEVVFG